MLRLIPHYRIRATGKISLVAEKIWWAIVVAHPSIYLEPGAGTYRVGSGLMAQNRSSRGKKTI